MPVFSPTIGKFGDVTARGKPWMLWYKRHKKHFYTGLISLIVFSTILGGWWLWYGRNIPAPGGILDEGMVGYPQKLNPLYSQLNEIDAELTPLIFRGLLRYDQNNELIPDLANKIEVSEDGTNYKITLSDHNWHDGAKVRAQDVAFTIGMTQDASYQGPWSGSFTDVAINIIDDHNLNLTLKEPYAPFKQSLTIGLLPEHILGGISASELINHPFNLEPIGTGKLEFESFHMNPKSKLVDQLRFDLVDGYIETVQYHFYDTLQAAMTDFKLGKLNSLGSLYDNQLKFLSDFEKQQHESILQGQTYGLFFNTQLNNVSDIKTRQALAYAIPKQAALEEVFSNHVQLADNIYTSNSWAFSDSFERYAFNIDEAKRLWEEIESKPQSLKLLIPDLPIHSSMAEKIANSWRELGVNVTIRRENSNEVGKLVDAGKDYDIVLLGEKANRDPDRYNNWHSTQTPPSGLNISRLKNDRVDKALEDGRKLLDINERKAKYATFQDYLARDAAVIWLYRPEYVYMWSNKVNGVKVGKIWNEQDRFETIEDWYINLAKR